MAAYKTLGGSFTGELGVDPSHRRDLRQREDADGIAEPRSDRARRIRDAVEAALSDILLLGTDEQVRLARVRQRTGTGAAGAYPRTGGLAARLRARSAGSGPDSGRSADSTAGADTGPLPVVAARAVTTAMPRAAVQAVAVVVEWAPAWAA